MTTPRLALFLCLFLPAPALSAPVPIEPKDDNAWVPALPPDIDGLVVIDVKAFMGSPLVQKGLMGKLPPLLNDQFLVPVKMKRLGLGPKTALKRLVLATSRGAWNGPDGKPTMSGGLLAIFETTKSSAALEEALGALARDGTKGVKAVAGAKGKMYEVKALGEPAIAAVLPGGRLLISPGRHTVEAALGRLKGAGAALKHAEMAKFVKGLKPGPMLNALVLAPCVISASGTSRGGAGAPRVEDVRLDTLEGSGFQKARAEATVKDTLKGYAELECKNAAEATRKAKEFREGLEKFKPLAEMQATLDPRYKNIAELLKKVTVKAAGKAVRFEAEAGPEAVKALELAPVPPDEGPGK